MLFYQLNYPAETGNGKTAFTSPCRPPPPRGHEPEPVLMTSGLTVLPLAGLRHRAT